MNETSALPSEEPVTITLSAESWRGWSQLAGRCQDRLSPEEFLELIGCTALTMQMPAGSASTPMDGLLTFVRGLRPEPTHIKASGGSIVAVNGASVVSHRWSRSRKRR